jgi:hypothetical protein
VERIGDSIRFDLSSYAVTRHCIAYRRRDWSIKEATG